MQQFWILYGGQLVLGPVYTNKHYSDEIRYPGDGRLGYIMQGDRDVTLVFSEKWQVFHAPEIDPERYEEKLNQRATHDSSHRD